MSPKRDEPFFLAKKGNNMQEQTATADVTAEMNDKEFDKYFEESAKEEAIEKDSPQAEEQTGEKAKEEEKEQAPDINKLMQEVKNYKGMGHQERERRKEIERKLQETEQRTQRMEEIFQRMVAQQNTQPEPSFDDNPLEAIRLKQERTDQYITQQQQIEAQRYQEWQQQQQLSHFKNKYFSDLESFSRDTPDFKEACDHLRADKTNEYLNAGYTQDQITSLLGQEEAAVAAKAYQDGVNPGERLYQWAKYRGYNPQAKQKTQATVENKLSQMQKGLQASKSLSSASGKSSNNPLSLEALAAMDDDELAKVDWDKFIRSNR